MRKTADDGGSYEIRDDIKRRKYTKLDAIMEDVKLTEEQPDVKTLFSYNTVKELVLEV